MGIYDTIMLILLAATAFIGWRKGMISQLAAIVSLVASFFLAMNFYVPVSASISATEPWNRIAAFVIIYLGTSLVVWFFFRQIRESVKRMNLGEFDRQLGGLLGAAKGVVVVTIITLMAVNLLTPGAKEAIAQSRSGYAVSRIVHLVGPMMPARVQQFLAGYVQELDAIMGGTPGGQDPYGMQVEGGYPSQPTTGYPNYPSGSYPPAGYGGAQPPYQPPSSQQPSQPPPPFDWGSTAEQPSRRYE